MPKKDNSVGKIFKDGFESLPPIVKMIVVIVVLILVFILVKRAFKIIQIKSDSYDTNSEIKGYQNAGESPSYPASKYQELATQLYNSMDGWGTDDPSFEDVFNQLNNNLDFLHLKNAFGVKDGYTFQEWIDGDLEADEKEAFNNLLRNKGINYSI